MRWRSAMAAIWISTLAVGSLAVDVQAEPPIIEVTFHATNGSCVDFASNSDLTAVDLVDHGTPVEAASLPFTAYGDDTFEACFPTAIVGPGLTLIAARVDLQHVNFTIPPLSVHVDRMTDVVRGVSRAHHHLVLRAYDCSVFRGKVCPRKLTRTVTANGSGHYSTDLTHAFDLRGQDVVSVTYTSSDGHTYRVLASVPYFDTLMGTRFVVGQVNPHEHVAFRLKSGPGGTTLSTRHVTGTAIGGHFSLTFSSSLRTGRQVTADFATDARVTLPSTTTSFAILSSDQVISTRCLPNRKLLVYWQGAYGTAVRNADSHGRATVNLSQAEHHAGFRLAHGGQVTVICQTAAGDIVERTIDVP